MSSVLAILFGAALLVWPAALNGYPLDFIDSVYARTGDATLQAAGNAVKTALSAAMLQEGHTGTDLADSHGLAIFLPGSGDWASLRSSYRLTDFAVNGAWDDWLDSFYGIGS